MRAESSFWFWFPLWAVPVALLFGAPGWVILLALPHALIAVLFAVAAPFALLDKYRELVKLGKSSN